MTAQNLISVIGLIFVVIGAASILIYQGFTGVPPMSSSAAEAANVVALLRQAGLSKPTVIYDLGSGWGSLVIALARAFPDAEVRGIELSPIPCWISRFRARKLINVSFRRADFSNCDLTGADAVTCYLMATTMNRVAGILDRMLAPKTPVISLSFWFRDREVAASLTSSGQLGAAALYYWPAHKSPEDKAGLDPQH